jgi:hypothetical protein
MSSKSNNQNFDQGIGELEELPRFRNHKVLQVTTIHNDKIIQKNAMWKKQYTAGVLHRDQVIIRPNSKFVFPELQGPGKITNIWFTAMPLANENKKNPLEGEVNLSTLRYAWRSVVQMIKYRKLGPLLTKFFLRIYFDGSETPSVDVPLGKFFGTGFSEYKHFFSRYIGMTAGGYVSQFRMPFKKSARVEIINTTEDMVCLAFYGAVTYNQYDSEKYIQNMGYFHADYHEEHPTTIDKPYLILEKTNGQGHFIGFVLNAINLKRKTGFSFLEGNTKFYVDGEKNPSIEFTGTEDIFQSAWYYLGTNRGQAEFSESYHGLTIKTFNKRGQIFFYLFAKSKHCKSSQYRFFPEGIPFKNDIKITIHHGEFDEVLTNYDTVAYYYLDQP